MAQFDMRSPAAFPTTGEIPAVRVTAFLRKVYGWMFVGLAVTAVVASTVAGSPTLDPTCLLQSNPLLRSDPGATRPGLLPFGPGSDARAEHGDDIVPCLRRVEWRDFLFHPPSLYGGVHSGPPSW